MAGTITRGKLTRADVALWDGKTATASRIDATGGTVTGLALGNDVDVLQVFGSGTDRIKATLSNAINHIGTSSVSLVLAPGTWTIDSNLTIPSNLSLKLPAGCILAPEAGVTLTVNGTTFCETPTKTGGSGTVSFVGGVIGPHRTAVEVAQTITPTDFSERAGWEARYSTLTDAIQQQDNGGVAVFAEGGGLRLRGSFGAGAGVVRPEAQLIIENTGTSGHAIMTLVNRDETDESAIEAVFVKDNAQTNQHGANFWRLVDSDNGASTFESVYAIHLTQYNADNTPFIAWARNSIQLCGGDTTTEKWHDPQAANWVDVYTSLKARTSLVAGVDHAFSTESTYALEVAGNAQVGDVDGSGVTDHAIQLGYSSGASSAFVQGYRNSTAAFIPLLIQGNPINIAGGNLVPTTDNAIDVGTASLRIKQYYGVNTTISSSDANHKTIRNGVTAEEIAWAKSIRMRCYQWNDALTEKGTGARLHWGVVAQEVLQAGYDAGIVDPLRYAFLCRDPATRKLKKLVSVQRQKEEECTEIESCVEVRGDRAVAGKKPVTKRKPVFREVPIFDEAGNPVTRLFEARDEQGNVLPPKVIGEKDGKPIFERHPKVAKQLTHRVPVMETVEEEVDVVEPILEPDGSQVWQYGIRYSELFAFLFATLMDD